MVNVSVNKRMITMPQFQNTGVVISGVYILSKAIIFLIYNYKFKVIIYDITLKRLVLFIMTD